MKEILLDYFLKYVKIDTMSAEDQNTIPSTTKQFDLARILVEDLKELGLKDIKLTDNCFVTAVLPSNCNSKLNIGFLAHMDTIPGFSGTNVKPNVINSYDGRIIKLNGIELNPIQFPFLNDLVGKTLVTTDGTTVLGADDKAGIADIMAMLYYYQNNPSLKHVNIHVAFTPDEEIGGGIEAMDVKGFSCDFAYTVDGGRFNEINFENFNAASAIIEVKGLDIHPGDAKNQMVNALRIAMEFDSMLPANEKPEYTEGYEGFYHLCEMSGCVGEAKLQYILRDHNLAKLEAKMKLVLDTAEYLNKKYGANTVKATVKHSYYNMAEIINKDPRSVISAKKAISDLGFTPITSPIRGGTDGAHLTQMGLNTPNLGTGGYNCHGPYEMACVEEMLEVVNLLIKIASEE